MYLEKCAVMLVANSNKLAIIGEAGIDRYLLIPSQISIIKWMERFAAQPQSVPVVINPRKNSWSVYFQKLLCTNIIFLLLVLVLIIYQPGVTAN